MTHITCRLTAKNRDQFRNPTLGNRATFIVSPSPALLPSVVRCPLFKAASHALRRCGLLLHTLHMPWFLCLSVCVEHTVEPRENGWTERDANRNWTRRAQGPCIRRCARWRKLANTMERSVRGGVAILWRPTTASSPSNPLNPSPLAPQIRLCWPLCAFINYIYLLNYRQSVHKPVQLVHFAQRQFAVVVFTWRRTWDMLRQRPICVRRWREDPCMQ